MLLNQTTRTILDAWQARRATFIEAGRRPVLDAGVSHTALDNLSILLAYQEFSASRQDVARPLLISGGTSPLWVAELMTPQARHPHPTQHGRVKATMVAFAGADPATIMAGTAVLTAAPLARAEQQLLPASADLPAGFGRYLQPDETPGTALPWEALPWADLHAEPATGNHADRVSPHLLAQTAADRADHAAGFTPDWVGPAALFLALCLLFFALVL